VQLNKKKLALAAMLIAALVVVTSSVGSARVASARVARGGGQHKRAKRISTKWSAVPGKVVIRRTSYGIPHILASSFYGAGEGYGFVFAQDDICTMANDYVTVDAQRSRYFGPTAGYTQGGNSVSVTNLDSDFFFQQIIDSGTVDKLANTPPPMGPVNQLHQLAAGYVDGYNRYLRSVGGSSGIPDPRCRGAAWVHPITLEEVYRRLYQLIELASGDVVIPGIAEAAPPAGGLPVTPTVGATPSPQTTARLLAGKLGHGLLGAIGSNAVAVGRAGTRDHTHGLLLGNPHFPWTGPERFYQAQITVPGQMNVSGASLFGVPLVLIGHTSTVAWSHTVSTAFRFTPFQLTLVPGLPTEYLYDGHVEKMTSRQVTVHVRQPDGSLQPETRTLYSSRFGPVFNSIEGIPLPWTAATAFALGDANADNVRILNTFFDFDRAHSVAQMLAILKRFEGIPWVNTIAADKQGNALYADIGAIPNVPDSLAAKCDTALGAATYQLLGLPVLDGSRSACNWATDSDAAAPGIFGASHLPHLIRSDYVTNSNDSYWLSNPHQPLTGFARIIGSEGTARSLRTRIGLIMTQARVDGSDGLGPAGFTLKDMENMVFSDRQYAGELWRDPLVTLCRGLSGGLAPTTSGAPVAVGDACDVLARWDLHENLDSQGAVLFRRFVDHVMADKTSPFAQPFSASDPVHTPSGLNTGDPQVSTALGDAIQDLEGAGIPLDASPRQEQYVSVDEQLPFDNAPPTAPVGGTHIPVHGGVGDPNGEFNAIYAPFIAGKGYAPVYFGSSFVQAITWNKGPCPVGGTILTYSLSDSTASSHHSDQTRLFSNHQWVTDRFCPAAVLARTQSRTVLPDDSPAGGVCPSPTGAQSGTRLGPLSLGLTRRRARMKLSRVASRSHRWTDYFCVGGGGIRVGYGRRSQLRSLPGRPLSLTNRIVWMTTANRHYRLDGLAPGARFSSARHLHPRGPIAVGRAKWYLVPDGPATGLLEVARGRISGIGIALRRPIGLRGALVSGPRLCTPRR
jgi:acyl-homoserine-lactone acylase